MYLAWGKKVTPQFAAAVKRICDGFGWYTSQANWLMACMAFESGETFDPAVKNMAGSGATGLIQFMPSTARGLGTTTDALARMTPIAQLEYVRRYFLPYHSKIATLPDMYMAILMPKYVGRAGSSVLFSGGVAYRQNAGLDRNKDGFITKDEASYHVQKKLDKGLTQEFIADFDI